MQALFPNSTDTIDVSYSNVSSIESNELEGLTKGETKQTYGIERVLLLIHVCVCYLCFPVSHTHRSSTTRI